MINYVVKRNGEKVPFDANKINQWMEWSTSIGVDWTDIALEAYRKCFDGCSTQDIQQSLITACLDKADTNHLKMAGRLYIGDIYKKVFGSHRNIPSLKSMYYKMNLIGRWANMKYSDAELDYLDKIIDHSKDIACVYSELKQVCNKYGISDLHTNTLYETPQFVYMRVALGSMNNRSSSTRIHDVVNVYNLLSNKEINAPTPYMLYFGTPHRGLSSCCLYTADDNIGSLAAGDHIAYMMTAMSAGIGAHLQTRSIGDPVRGGSIIHQGKLPYYRALEGVLLANKQGSRSGAATVHYCVLDPEIFDLISLRNPMSIAEKRIPNMDYSTGYNDYFAHKVAKNEDWMLISYYYAKDLWESLYSDDIDKFISLYKKYETDSSVPKKFVSARKIAFSFLKEAPETGRSYHHNLYELNRHTPFKDKINSSNLCVAGDQRVPSNYGLLTAKELFELDCKLKLFDNRLVVDSSKMKLRQVNVDTFKITLKNGLTHTVTADHSVMTINGLVKYSDLKINDLVSIQTKKGAFGYLDMPDEAFLLGLYQADGTQFKDIIMLDLYSDKTLCLKEPVQKMFNKIHYKYGCDRYDIRNQTGKIVGSRSLKPAQFYDCVVPNHCNYTKIRLASKTLKKSLNFDKGYIPQWIWESNEKTQWEYIKGLFYCDGHISLAKNNTSQLGLTNTNKAFLQELQLLLLNLGVQFALCKHTESGFSLLPDSHGESKEYMCNEAYRLVTSNKSNILEFDKHTNILVFRNSNIGNIVNPSNIKEYSRIVKLEYVGKQDVYCPTVESKEHLFIANGIITSNCQEISVPTSPYSHILELFKSDSDGEIGLCNLMAICQGRIKNDAHYEQAAYYCLAIIHEAIHLMNYPFPSLEYSAKSRMSAGVGVINLAYDMANKGFVYDHPSGKAYLHRVAERHSYFLHKAAVQITKEKGICNWAYKTKYKDGWLPIDTYRKSVDLITDQKLIYDWESIRRDIVELHGLAFSVLEAHMPAESSSLASNATNSLYPIRKGIVIKTNGTDKNVFIAPDWENLKHQYQMAEDIDSKDLIDMYAIFQKFTGQAISADLYLKYNNDGSKRKVSGKKLIKDFLHAVASGVKTRYYLNVFAGVDIVNEQEKGCAGGSCTL